MFSNRISAVLSILFSSYTLFNADFVSASKRCQDSLSNRHILESIRSEVLVQTDARTLGGLDALRSVELPVNVAKARIEEILSKDSFISQRLSPQDRSGLADALLDVKNKNRESVKVIYRYVFLRELPPLELAQTSALPVTAISQSPEAPKGMIESRIAINELRMQDIERQAREVITQLDIGGDDWSPLNSSLVETITEAVKEYNHTNFDMYTPQMVQAIEKIKTALRNSEEFGALDASGIDDLSQVLASRNRNLRTPMFGTKHMLYHALVEMGLSQSQSLTRLLVSIQKMGNQKKQLSERNWELESMLNSGLRGVADIRELEARYQRVQNELNTSAGIPDDLVTSLVALAQEYNNSRMGNFDVLTSGMNVAMRKYEMLVRDHPFFRNVRASRLEDLQWSWYQATTPQKAINILSSAVGNNALEAKQNELRLLAKAIQYFREN